MMPEDVKRGYTKYCDALQKIVPRIDKDISRSPNKEVIIKVKDLTKKMGKEFEKLHPTSIYWGVKYNMFQEGIIVSTKKTKEGELALVMRHKTEIDLLPATLIRYVDSGNIPACPITKKKGKK